MSTVADTPRPRRRDGKAADATGAARRRSRRRRRDRAPRGAARGRRRRQRARPAAQRPLRRARPRARPAPGRRRAAEGAALERLRQRADRDARAGSPRPRPGRARRHDVRPSGPRGPGRREPEAVEPPHPHPRRRLRSPSSRRSLARAAWVQLVHGPALSTRWRRASTARRSRCRPDAARSSTAPASRSRSASSRPRSTPIRSWCKNPQQVAVETGKALGLDPNEVYNLLRDRRAGSSSSQRQADPIKAAALAEAAASPGLGFYAEEKRTYPQGRVGAQVIGYAGTDNLGLEGLERSLEKKLRGRAGAEIVVKDPFGRAIDVVKSRAERPGKDVTLTLDHQVQAATEKILLDTVRAVRRTRRHRDRDGPRERRRDPRDGECADDQREPVRQGAARPPAQPRRHRHLRAGLDVQDRHRRRRARGRGRRRPGRPSCCSRRSRSPTASSTRRTSAAPSA